MKLDSKMRKINPWISNFERGSFWQCYPKTFLNKNQLKSRFYLFLTFLQHLKNLQKLHSLEQGSNIFWRNCIKADWVDNTHLSWWLDNKRCFNLTDLFLVKNLNCHFGLIFKGKLDTNIIYKRSFKYLIIKQYSQVHQWIFW